VFYDSARWCTEIAAPAGSVKNGVAGRGDRGYCSASSRAFTGAYSLPGIGIADEHQAKEMQGLK
jgi:hypothetical protein